MIKSASSDESLSDDFAVSLYQEHLEDGSFLYGQRPKLLENSEISWKNTGEFEERLQAHINGLLVGGKAALEVCKQQAGEGGPGELYMAMCVFCRQGRRDLFIEVLEQIDPEDKEKLGALTDALKYELPTDWQDDFVSLLQTDDEQLCALVSMVVGYRRIPSGSELLQALRRYQPAPLIRAVGRLRERNAISLLLHALRHEDEAVCSAAALALIRLGEWQAVDFCREVVGEKWWATTHLALGCGRSDLQVLLDISRPDDATPDALLALGFLGDCSAVPLLLEKLGGEQVENAAQALNLLTGAEIYERVFIPDEVNEDELFPEELAAFRNEGKVPTKPDGTPYGEWVTRLSHKPEEWLKWWGRNRQLFSPGIRYRNGKLLSPASLLENLRHEKTPHRLRQLAYEELVIRYDVDFPFEADLFVVDQLRILDEVDRWVAVTAGRFQAGAWYFAGKMISS